MEYLNWDKILSYNADVTFVTDTRGKGKTYGLRKKFVEWYLKTGERFCEVGRYKNELNKVSNGYFEKIQANGEFPEYDFKYTTTQCFISPKPEEGEKHDWQCCGYFVPLSTAGQVKKSTFVNVRNVVLDEAIIDKTVSPYERYLPNEFYSFVNVLDSVTREHPGEPGYVKPRVFLLANACDLMNPYFHAYGIKRMPKKGFSWHKTKTMLLYYGTSQVDAEEKLELTVTGRMLKDTKAAEVAAYNAFPNADNEYIQKKPKDAAFQFGFVWDSEKYGVWYSKQQAYYYINQKVPRNAAKPVYALSTKENGLDYTMARKGEPALKMLAELYMQDCVLYDCPATREKFVDVLRCMGVR